MLAGQPLLEQFLEEICNSAVANLKLALHPN
jgi:hypothetical protein